MADPATDTARMEGIRIEVVKLVVRPQHHSAFALVEFRESERPLLAAWKAVMRLRVELTISQGDDVKTLCERACAEARAYFDEDCD